MFIILGEKPMLIPPHAYVDKPTFTPAEEMAVCQNPNWVPRAMYKYICILAVALRGRLRAICIRFIQTIYRFDSKGQ